MTRGFDACITLKMNKNGVNIRSIKGFEACKSFKVWKLRNIIEVVLT